MNRFWILDFGYWIGDTRRSMLLPLGPAKIEKSPHLSMSHRYYADQPIAADRVTLAGNEAHHLLHVLRGKIGMRIVLFDGSGDEFDAEIVSCGRTTVDLAVLERRHVKLELACELTLGVPLPKGDRQRWIVEKAVELGVSRLVPLRTERSIGGTDKGGEKLDRYVIEASKQCGRNRLMRIAPRHSWLEWLASPPANARRFVADPTGRPLDRRASATDHPTFAAVGPEGGFTEQELAAADAAGWDCVVLGPRILRIETAAVALAALLTCGQ